jgi:hypothetical protein
MTVLKPEVWLSIVAALTVTAFMIWILDKYSPYSAQNNQPKYEQFRYNEHHFNNILKCRTGSADSADITAAQNFI